MLVPTIQSLVTNPEMGGGGTPCNGLYGDAPPERSTDLPFSGLRDIKG